MKKIAAALALLTASIIGAEAQVPYTYPYKTANGGNINILAGLLAGNVLPYTAMIGTDGTPIGTLSNPLSMRFGTGVTLPSFTTPQHFICDSGCSGGGGGGGLSVPFNGPIGANGTPIGFKDQSGNLQPLLGGANGQFVEIKASTGLTISSGVVSIAGSLPGFASTPTVNIGTAPTLTVTGSVGITGSPTVTVGNASLAVTGTFWQATQPISAASLPLPAGAATAALQSTGNASLSSIDGKTPQLGQQLPAASTPVVLPAAQITALTPPTSVGISGTLPAFAATPTVNIGTAPTITVTGGVQVTQGSASNLNATVVGTGTFPVQVTSTVNQYGIGASTLGANGNMPLGAATTAAPTYTSGQLNPLSLTLAGALRIDGSAVTQPISGSVSLSGTSAFNQTQVNGNAVAVGNGVVGTGVQRVAIASDNTAFSVNSVQSGTWSNRITDGTSTAAVKAASTAPLATDPALVVTISPNGQNPNGAQTISNSQAVNIASDQIVPVLGQFGAGAVITSPSPVLGGCQVTTSSPTAKTDGTASQFYCDPRGNLNVDIRSNNQPINAVTTNTQSGNAAQSGTNALAVSSATQLYNTANSNYDFAAVDTGAAAGAARVSSYPSTSSNAAMTSARSTALGSGIVGKNGAGNFFGAYCTAITGEIVGGSTYCVAYDAASVPVTGALTPANVLGVCSITDLTGCTIRGSSPFGIAASSGVVVLLTSAVTPFTYTSGTNQGFLSAEVK